MQADCEERWDPSTVRLQFQVWGRPSSDSHMVDEDGRQVCDIRRVARLSETLLRHMDEVQAKFLAQHSRTPMLLHYQSDAKGSLTMYRTRQGQLGSSQTHSACHDLCEFLSERLFMVAGRGLATSDTAMVFRPPRLLRHGKTASNHLTALRDCIAWPFASGLQHSIVISGFCWDRAICQANFRLIQQDHAEQWDRMGPLLHAGRVEMVKNLDIVLATGCALHDLATGLRWATFGIIDKDQQKHLFNCIEGLRNGSRFLFKVLPTFIHTCLHADAGSGLSEEQEELFWNAVAASPGMLPELTALQPRWEGGMLKVRAPDASSAGLYDRVAAVVTMPWRFKKFNTSRFLVMGSGSRLLTLSRMLGLDRVVQMGRAAPASSDYWLHHYEGLDDRMALFCAACGMGSQVCDALMCELMEDPRAALNLEALTTTMIDHMEHLVGLPDFVWQRLARAVSAEQSWTEVRDMAQTIASVCSAWFDQQVLSVARRRPWAWCRGDLLANAKQIARLPAEGLDEVTHKLRMCLRLGLSTISEVATSLHLLGQVPWTTLAVEQAHGSIACMHRFHPDMSAEHLALRSFLNTARSLFDVSPEEKMIRRLEAQLERTFARNFNKVSATAVFVAELRAVVKDVLGAGARRTLGFWQDDLKSTGARWRRLPAEEKDRWAEIAKVWQQEKWEQLHAEQDYLSAAIQLLRQRLRDDEPNRVRSVLGAHRLQASRMDWLACLFRTLPESQQAAVEVVARSIGSVLPVPEGRMQMLQQKPHQPLMRQRSGPPGDWLRTMVVWRQDWLRTCILRVDSNTRLVAEAWLVVAAIQQPYHVLFQRCSHMLAFDHAEVTRHVPPLDAPTDLPCEVRVWPVLGQYASDLDLEVDLVDDEWFVQTGLRCDQHGWLTSPECMQTWQRFTMFMVPEAAQPAPALAPKAAAKKRPRREAMPEWARQWFSAPASGPAGADRTTHAPPAPVPVPTALTAEQQDVVDLEVAEMRAWLAETYPMVQQNFYARVLGGGFTSRKTKGRQAWDALQGYARTKRAQEWCRSNGLQESMRFGRTEHGRTEALWLAQMWIARMWQLMEMWEQEGERADWWQAGMEVGVDDLELVDAMIAADSEGELYRRGAEIRALVPRPAPMAG